MQKGSKLMKKITALFLSLLLSLSFLASCQTEDVPESPSPTVQAPASAEPSTTPPEETDNEKLSLPLVDEKTTFTGWITSSAIGKFQTDLNDNPTFQELENRTNIHMDWRYPTQGGETEALNLMFSSNDYTDTIITLGPGDYIGGFDKFIEDEIIYDLKDLVNDNCPNYLEVIKRDSTVYKQLHTDTGNLPSFRMMLTERQLCYLGYYARQDLLDAAGYTKTPVTYGDWHEMLVALKGSTSKQPMYLFEAILSAGYGASSEFMQIDGKVTYGPMTNEYRDYLSMVADWYSEGLIDTDFMTRRHFFLDFGEFLNGSFALYPMVSAFYDTFTASGMQIKVLPYAKVNESDKRVINSGSSETTLQGATGTITTDCENPVLMARWYDYLYSPDGSLLGSYGIEGQSYTMENGKPVFTDLIMKNTEDLTAGDAKSSYAFSMSLPYLVMTERENDTLSEGAYKATELWDTDWDLANTRTIQGDLTADESVQYTSIFNDINTYVSEFKSQVISGTVKITDETWSNFVDQLNSMRIDRCIELKQAAMDRYNAR